MPSLSCDEGSDEANPERDGHALRARHDALLQGRIEGE